MNGEDLVIVVPIWKRTEHVDRVRASALAATPDARVLFVPKHDDPDALAAVAAYDHIVGDWPGGSPGDYARSINAGYRATSRPFIFTGADDLDFHPGWYEAARAFMDPLPLTDVFDPDRDERPPVGVVGTVDLCNDRTMRGEHSTHSLVARWYADCCAVADRPGAIYCEQYPHDYCDDELVQTARARGAYAHAHDAVVEHLHPNAEKAPDDDTYRRGRAMRRRGRVLFSRRQRLWA